MSLFFQNIYLGLKLVLCIVSLFAIVITDDLDYVFLDPAIVSYIGIRDRSL